MKILHVHNVAFVGTTLVDALNNTENIKAIFFERERFSKGMVIHLKNMIKFRSFVNKKNPDIIHIHYLPTSLYALFAGKKFILHLHGSDIRGLSITSKEYCVREIIYRKFKKYILRKAQLVFYSTPNLKKDVDVVRKDAIFIPNPIKIKTILKKEVGELKKTIDILFFAALSDHKGADIAFPAFEKIKSIYNDKVNIVCINFGKEKEKYNKYSFVRCVEKIKHENINDFLNEFDIIIGQLKVGAIGVSELEVMGLGIPLISNFKYNDFYQEECPLISCGSSEEVINAIQELFTNEKFRLDTSRKQFEWVCKYHKDINVVFKLINNYKAVL